MTPPRTPTDHAARTRRDLLAGGALLGAGAALGSAGSALAADRPPTGSREARNERIIRRAFRREVGGPDSFYAILDEDVRWTVAGANPSTYTSRAEFFERGSGPITSRLGTPIRPTIRALYSEGDVVTAVWDGRARTRDNRVYTNQYVWIMTLRRGRVVRVVAYLDTAAIRELVARVPAAP